MYGTGYIFKEVHIFSVSVYSVYLYISSISIQNTSIIYFEPLQILLVGGLHGRVRKQIKLFLIQFKWKAICS